MATKLKIIQSISRLLYKVGFWRLSTHPLTQPTIYKIADKVVESISKDEFFEIQGFKIKRGKTTRKLFLTGDYEQVTTSIIKDEVKQGMRVFDLGANIGWFTLVLSKLVGEAGHVYSFLVRNRHLEN